MKIFKNPLTKKQFEEVMLLLQSENEEDFMLGKAILESKNIRMGKSRLDRICTEKLLFSYIDNQLMRQEISKETYWGKFTWR